MSAQQPASTAPAASAPVASAGARARDGNGRQALGLAGSLLLLGFACRELLRFQPRTSLVVSISGDVDEWFFEPSDSSPAVVLALCAWLLWRRRARLAALWGRPGPVVWTAVPWLAALGIFAWAVRAGAPDLQAIALGCVLLGAANLLGGPAALRVVAVPAAVLVFALPLPAPLLNQIVWALQTWTADFTGALLELLRLPVLVSGDHILLSGHVFAIIETCSGLRSMETLALLAVLMIDLFGRRGAHAVALLLATPLVAFAINGLRCLGLIFNPHADIASIHSLQGIAMLLCGVLLLYFFDGLLARLRGVRSAERLSSFERLARRSADARRPLGTRIAVLGAFAVLLAGVSWLPRFDLPPIEVANPWVTVPSVLDGWQGADVSVDWLFLGRAAFGASLHREYTKGPNSVDVFLGQADPGGRLRSHLSPKIAYPGGGWLVEDEEAARVAGRAATLRVLRKGAHRLLVAHWFEASPGLAEETVRALLALDTSPLQRTRIPMAVRLATPLPSTLDQARQRARERLEHFGGLLSPELDEMAAPKGLLVQVGKHFPN